MARGPNLIRQQCRKGTRPMNGTTRFNRDTTADEIVAGIDLAGKRFLVTGASSGTRPGDRPCAGLARCAGHSGRSFARERPSRSGSDPGNIRRMRISTSSRSISPRLPAFAPSPNVSVSSYNGLDGIVANAGVMAIDSARTLDGFEMQFGANHLGHFVLVNRLAPLLQGTGAVATCRAELRGPSASRRRPQ